MRKTLFTLLVALALVPAALPQGTSLGSHTDPYGRPITLQPFYPTQTMLSDTDADGHEISGLGCIRFVAQAVLDLGMAKDVYLAPRTDDKPGSGLPLDPYDASTAAKFDARMLSFPAGTKIHLSAGTFQTNAQATWALKANWLVEGAGMYQTTVQLIGTPQPYHWAMFRCDNTPGVKTSNITLRGFTIDCNFDNLTSRIAAGGEFNHSIFGVGLQGDNNLCEYVRLIHQYGSLVNDKESFGINNGGGNDDVTRFCRVELPLGTYSNPYSSFDSVRHRFYSNTAIGYNTGLARTSGFVTGGVNAANLTDFEMFDNTFIDCAGIFYQDTGFYDGLKIYNNRAVRAAAGVSVLVTAPGTSRKVEIYGNRIGVQNKAEGGNSSWGIRAVTGATITDIWVHNNNISYTADGAGSDNFNSVIISNAVQVKVEDNQLDNGVAEINGADLRVNPQPGVVVRNNRNALGQKLPFNTLGDVAGGSEPTSGIMVRPTGVGWYRLATQSEKLGGTLVVSYTGTLRGDAKVEYTGAAYGQPVQLQQVRVLPFEFPVDQVRISSDAVNSNVYLDIHVNTALTDSSVICYLVGQNGGEPNYTPTPGAVSGANKAATLTLGSGGYGITTAVVSP